MSLLITAVELTDGHPSAAATGVFSPPQPRAIALEAAGVTLVTIADAPNAVGAVVRGPEAGVTAAVLSTATTRIGIAPVLSATTTEPFLLATQVCSLDHFSHGRAAWLVSAPYDAGSRATVGWSALTAAQAAAEAREVVEVSRRLWDSWQDDAVIADTATGRFTDADRIHHVGFTGEAFSVLGPLITPRSPQGQVLVIAPAELGLGDAADLTLVSAPDAAALRERAHAVRCLGGTTHLIAEVEVALDADEPAHDRLARLGAWPETGRLRHVGSGAALVDLLAGLADSVDGVRLHVAEHAVDVEVLAAEVLPTLERRGLHRPPASGATLRDTLGLPRPASRYAAAPIAV